MSSKMVMLFTSGQVPERSEWLHVGAFRCHITPGMFCQGFTLSASLAVTEQCASITACVFLCLQWLHCGASSL